MVFLLMMFFGVMGMLAYALDPQAYNDGTKFAFLAFFDLIEPLASAWQVLVLLLVTALAASSIDSLQSGLTSITAADIVKIGWNPMLVTRFLIVLVNVPAVYLALKKYDVISLFLVADLACAMVVVPVYAGFQTSDRLYGYLKAPTEVGAFLGCLSGFAAVLVNGAVNQTPGGVFNYFWLPNGDICALCGGKTMVSFIVTPAVSGVMTYVFSYLDVRIRGDRARQPLIAVAFDEQKQLDDDDVDGNRGDKKDGSDYCDDLEKVGGHVREREASDDGDVYKPEERNKREVTECVTEDLEA